MVVLAWAFLLIALFGAWLTLNAYRPRRSTGLLLVPSFFAGWWHSELVLHALAVQVAVVAGFVWYGVLTHVAGWIALAVTVISWSGMIGLLELARRTGRTLGAALREGLGGDYKHVYSPEVLARVRRNLPWSQLAAPLWLRARSVEVLRDLRYSHEHSRQRLDLYRRRGADYRRAPVLLQIHGGGWVIGDKRQQGLPLVLHLAAEGWICASINYRLSPAATFPEHIIDIKRAIAWLRAHVEEYGGDPEFIAITGGSAGGHLCSLAALTPNLPAFQPGFEDADTRVAACVPFYGIYDFTRAPEFQRKGTMGMLWLLERYVFKRRLADDPDAFTLASPIFHVHADAPPFLVLHGALDNLVPVSEARRFVAQLREHSRAPVVYGELAGAHHAFDVFYSPRTQQAIRGVDRFLSWVYARYLQGEGDASAGERG